MIQNILVEYGVKILLPILQNAVKVVIKDFYEESLGVRDKKRGAVSVLESVGRRKRRAGVPQCLPGDAPSCCAEV